MDRHVPPGMMLEDQMNLCLVEAGLKKASSLRLEADQLPQYVAAKRGEDESLPERMVIDNTSLSLWRTYLQHRDVEYHEELATKLSRRFSTGDTIIESKPFLVGHGEDSLRELYRAWKMPSNGPQRHLFMGEALDFPLDEVFDFGQTKGGVKRDWKYTLMEMARAKQREIEVPSWLAYLSFVPTQLDLVTGDVSDGAKERGLMYQSFMQEHHPSLAERIEQKFYQTALPSSWIVRDGNIHLVFE